MVKKISSMICLCFFFFNRPDVRVWVLAVRVSIQALNED